MIPGSYIVVLKAGAAFLVQQGLDPVYRRRERRLAMIATYVAPSAGSPIASVSSMGIPAMWATIMTSSRRAVTRKRALTVAERFPVESLARATIRYRPAPSSGRPACPAARCCGSGACPSAAVAKSPYRATHASMPAISIHLTPRRAKNSGMTSMKNTSDH